MTPPVCVVVAPPVAVTVGACQRRPADALQHGVAADGPTKIEQVGAGVLTSLAVVFAGGV
jgi:hypothetical protein